MPVDVAGDITATIDQVLRESGRPTRSWEPHETLLGDIGLDSLDLAVVVVQLEQRLGVDPFRSGSGGVRNLGDFIARYQAALNHPAGPQAAQP
jgi:acyl carrier protein